MNSLSRADLWSLEQYAELRTSFRQQVMLHKRSRQLALGDHLRLYFEDALTIKYQIQEILRVEKIFEAQDIDEELQAYNPLIPDGHNWKATLMLEYADPAERARRLVKLVGIEHHIWLQVAGCGQVFPIADEDLERSSAEKTSAVHFLRFELTPAMITAISGGAALTTGVDHDAYSLAPMPVPEAVRESLLEDLDSARLH